MFEFGPLWAAAGALVSAGVTLGMQRAENARNREEGVELKRRLEKLETCAESMGSLERVEADVARHEREMGSLDRHLRDVKTEVAVLKALAHKENP